MTGFEIALLVLAGVLCLAALPVAHRMVVGPTILDRAVATDMLVVMVVIGLGLYTAWSGAEWAGVSMLALSGLAFIGTVTVARFVAREEPRMGSAQGGENGSDAHGESAASGQGRRASQLSTETSEFFSIRPDDFPSVENRSSSTGAAGAGRQSERRQTTPSAPSRPRRGTHTRAPREEDRR